MQFEQPRPISLSAPTFNTVPSHYRAPSTSQKSDGYAKTQTHFQFPWPADINGIERVVLSAKGDLQRVLSAFFGSPINVTLEYKSPSCPASSTASCSTPIIQERRVHEFCENKLVVIATSTVKMFSPLSAALILDEKYAIGQCYRVMGVNPDFELVSVTLDHGVDGKERVTRRYVLRTELMECEIEEIFVDRAMFREEGWLYSAPN